MLADVPGRGDGLMAHVTTPIVFPNDDPAPMLTHLDRWAADTVTDAAVWGSMVERCGLWADYSPRNQILLASYGIATPVAGSVTWEQVPSREAGRPCAVRAGENGLPVRVPVDTTVNTAPSSRSRHGQRSTRTAVSHRWETVFAEEQLARRPLAGTLAWTPVPAELVGAGGNAAYVEAVRHAVSRLTGHTPRRVRDPWDELVTVAGAVPIGARRPELRPALCRQAAWLVADRLGHAPGPLPSFDPAGLRGRLRWELLADTRRAVDTMVRAFSEVLEVDLTASPLPRMDVADDRTVAPSRRNYLAPADVAALPMGLWVEAGPYSVHEWAARGVAGAQGRGAFLRVSDTGYLAVYETAVGANWRVETTRAGRRGLLDEGAADTYTAAQRAVARVLVDRYPNLAAAVLPAPADVAPVRVFDPASADWQPLPGARDARTQQRTLTDRVQLIVAPGPGGRWENWMIVDAEVRQLPLTADADAARSAAELAGRRVVLEHAAATPQLADQLVADAAAGGVLDRDLLADVIGHRLDPDDRTRLADVDLPAADLVRLLGAAGVLTSTTIVDVLVAEHVPVEQVAEVVPTIGLPIPDGIDALTRHFDVDRISAGQLLGATMAELRAAGATPAELLAAHPREALRSLDTRPHTWELAAATLLEAGLDLPVVIRHLAEHAPTSETFAIGVTTVCDDPLAAFACSARHASGDDLAALGDAFGLAPDITAQLLADAGTHPTTALEAITIACDGDIDAVTAIAERHLNMPSLVPTNLVDLTTMQGLRNALPPAVSVDTSDLAAHLAAIANASRQPAIPTATTSEF